MTLCRVEAEEEEEEERRGRQDGGRMQKREKARPNRGGESEVVSGILRRFLRRLNALYDVFPVWARWPWTKEWKLLF